MQVLSFAAEIGPDRQGLLDRFPRLQEALTGADTEAAAFAEVEGYLGEALAARLERGDAIPMASSG